LNAWPVLLNFAFFFFFLNNRKRK